MAVLRYPYDAITETTDYLQIDIDTYNPIGSELVRSRNTQEASTLTSRTKNVSSPTNLSISPITSGDSILLPMPSNLQDGNSVTYADDSMNGLVAQAVQAVSATMETKTASGAIGGIAGLFNLGVDKEVKKAVLRSLAAEAVNIFGSNVSPNSILARQQGDIFNPNMELLFNGVTLRSFKFSFKMTPRSKKEAEQIGLIIRSLKQNMAAKYKDKNYLSTPNTFNLEYKKGSDPHPFLHSFKKCALTDISVNYTGENIYATYNDGSPISYIMDLTFKELEPIYDIDYNSGTGVGF